MWQEGVMGGGGDDWYNVILLTVTPGVTVTITDGDEEIEIVGTGSQQAATIHNENATYTISANENGLPKSANSVTTDSTSGKLFIRELKMAAIEVTFDDDFRSESFTISDGTTTSTAQTFPASGNTMDIFVPSTGTWTISSSVSGDSYDSTGAHVTDLDGTYTDEIHVIPVGATVTPVNDIQLWLECAAIRNKPYTKLEEVLADEVTLIKLMSDSNAVDYLKRSTQWINTGLVPVMTDNTHPSGVAFSSNTANQPAWKAFDGDESTGGTTDDAVNGYFGYIFPSQTPIGKIRIKCGTYNDTFTLQGSNDTTTGADGTWENIKDIKYPSTGNTIFEIGVEANYKAYRLLQKTHASSYNLFTYYLIQFFTYEEGIVENELAMQAIGAYDYAADTLLADSDWAPAIIESEYWDDAIIGNVPVLTSNNANPSGIVMDCSGTLDGDVRYAAYHAFDGIEGNLNQWVSNFSSSDGGKWISVEFPEAVRVVKFKASNKEQSSGLKNGSIKLQGSNDGFVSDIHELGTFAYSSSTKEISLSDVENPDEYKYYRLYSVSDTTFYNSRYYTQFSIVQFYFNEPGGVQSWLKAAGISKPYTTLDEVIADSDALATLVTNHDAVDYLVTAKGLIDGITSSPKAMRYIGYRNYCADTLLADSEWLDAIVNSEYRLSVLNVEVPVMTGDTTPSGEVTQSSFNNNREDYKGWNVFTEEEHTGYWAPQTGDVTNQWITYKFPSPVKIYYVSSKVQGTYCAKHYKYQGSNDGLDFDNHDLSDIVDVAYDANDYYIDTALTNVDNYQYYRFFVIDSWHGTYLGHKKIRYYGRTDVDETKIHILSAASDAVKDVTSGTAVTLCTTDTDGHYAINRTDIPVGTYKLESTVALDPDGNMSTDLYQKEVNVTNDTVEITVMPDGALYWWGYKDNNVEPMSSANGWTNFSRNLTYSDLSFNTNEASLTVPSSSYWTGIGTRNTVDIEALVSVASNAGSSIFLRTTESKAYANERSINMDLSSISRYTLLLGEKRVCYPYVVNAGNTNNVLMKALWAPGRNKLSNFFSAAKDTVYYTVGGTDIVVAETNEFGEAVVDFNSIPSGVILYSSVAKDPTNLSNPYTKVFVPPVNDRFYFMPDNALYWYGYMSDDCEECTTENGWEMESGYTESYPIYGVNDAQITNSVATGDCGLSSKKKVSGNCKAIIQGITSASGYYGYYYLRNTKTFSSYHQIGSITNDNLAVYGFDNVVDKYFSVATGYTRNEKVYAMWYDAHDTKSNFFSAANDRVYYLDGATPVYVAETNAMGEAWIDLSKIPNGVTLYSSIAKDLTNPSQPFGKTFSVGSDGKFYLMPDGEIIYWYGLELKKIATARQSNAGTVTKNKNNMTISPRTGSAYTSVDLYTENLIDLSAYDNLNMMVQYDNTSSGWYRLGCDATLSNWTGGYSPTTYEQITPSTVAQKASLNISSLSDSEYCGYITDVNNTTTVYALWLD